MRVLLALSLVTACAAAKPPPAIYRVVHMDTLAPDRVATFERGRRDWIEALRRADTTDGRGVFLQIDDHQFFTVRSFATFASFDHRSEEIGATMTRVPAAASEAYDRLSDTSLVFPHTSEIWRLDDDLAYRPATGALTEATADAGTLVVENVRPDPASEKRYWDATAEIVKALAEAHYPLTRLGFTTVYGAGHVMTLVLAPSAAALAAAPSVLDVVAKVRGAARAAELATELDAAVEKRETHAVVVRHDLTWRPPLP